MQVKVFIARKVSHDKEDQLRPLLMKLRILGMEQPGYISGETLINVDDPEDYMVVSSWKSLEDWNRWFESAERRHLQGEVDKLLGEQTLYEIFYFG